MDAAAHEIPGSRPIALARWLQRSYLRAAVIPLVFIELGFLAVYWVSGVMSYRNNVEAVAEISRAYLTDIAMREAATVDATLDGVALLTDTLARSTGRALSTPASPPAEEKARYGYGPGGSFVTLRGDRTRDAAAFYSGAVPVGPAQIEKVWRSTALDPQMRDIAASSPLVAQVYVNTSDSYNRIYPYFDVLTQYAPKMRIPDYNFYYEADARHNPARRPVWTDAYVDPAGSGWMVSSIAPVYSGDRLDAVVGIDVTVASIIRHVLDIRLPWRGYALLIGRDGTILALPAAAEHDLGLRELKGHRYDHAIRQDTFKPAAFNVRHRPDLAPLAAQLQSGRQKVSTLRLSGRDMIVATSTLPETGWSLAVMVPESEVFAEADALRERFVFTGWVMAGVLMAFYLGFFALLVRRSKAMSRRVAEPLGKIEAIMARIGEGEYRQEIERTGIVELDRVSESLVTMGGSLGEAHSRITAQEDEIRRALEREQETTRGQRRFISVMSHELRTPLTIIDSTGQILRRRANRLDEAAICERADRIREAASRIGSIVDSAVDFATLDPVLGSARPGSVAVSDVVAAAVSAQSEARRIAVELSEPQQVLAADGPMLIKALSAVLDNALKYGGDGPVTLHVRCDAQECRFCISDQGPGLSPGELEQVTERFFRGSNSTAVPGAGVGLYLARRWLEAQGGSLRLSNGVGGGLVATVIMPAPKVNLSTALVNGEIPDADAEALQSGASAESSVNKSRADCVITQARS